MKRLLIAIICFSASSTIHSQIVTEMKVPDLSSSITENIAKTEPGYSIKQAHKIENKEIITYEVVIAKGSSEMTLLYDKDGKFVRKESVKRGTVITKEQKKNINAKPKSETVKK